MKSVLEFNLPEDSAEFELACNAGKLHGVLWDLDQWLRGIIKYNDSLPDEHIQIYQKVRDKLYEELNESNISL
jgi:hypothetical protein